MDIKDLVNRVVDGTMSTEEVGQMLAARHTVAVVPQNRTDEEVEELARRAANDIVDEFKSNTLEEVMEAYYAGRLTDQQYGTIMRAVTKPKNSTDAWPSAKADSPGTGCIAGRQGVVLASQRHPIARGAPHGTLSPMPSPARLNLTRLKARSGD